MLERLRINATVGTRCRSGKHAVVGEIMAARKLGPRSILLVSYMPLGSSDSLGVNVCRVWRLVASRRWRAARENELSEEETGDEF